MFLVHGLGKCEGIGEDSRYELITHVLECMFSLEHCICTQVESSPFRVIPLLSISSPCRGNIFFRYRERTRRRLILEVGFEKKSGLWLRLSLCIHVLEF